MFEKVDGFSFNHSDQADRLSDALTADEVKANFDSRAEEIRVAFNALIDALMATASGDSGSNNIGATAIDDLDGSNIQAIMESIRNKLKSTADSASGADFIAATAISGLTGSTVQALLEALKAYIDSLGSGQTAALNAHKTSADHDGRYYTGTEVDSKFVSKTNLENTRKLSAAGDFTGSWFGVTNPAKSDPGIAGLVELHSSQLADLMAAKSDIVIIGDSLVEGDELAGMAISVWLKYLVRKTVTNKGVWGNTITQVRGRLQTDVIDLLPKYCIVLCGTNDINSGRAINDIITDALWIMDELLKNSIEPVFVSVPPRSDNTTLLPKIRDYNNRLSYWCERKRIRFVDIYSPLSTDTGTPISGILGSDNLHWVTIGAYKAAQYIATAFPTLQNYDDKILLLADSIHDNYQFTGSSTTDSEGTIGNLWSKNSTGVAAYSLEDNPNGGKYQVIAKTDDTTNYKAGIMQKVGGYSVGATYRTELDLEFEVTSLTDSDTYVRVFLFAENNSAVDIGTYGFTYYITTLGKVTARPFVDFDVPINAYRIRLEVLGKGGSAFTLKLGRVWAYKLA